MPKARSAPVWIISFIATVKNILKHLPTDSYAKLIQLCDKNLVTLVGLKFSRDWLYR